MAVVVDVVAVVVDDDLDRLDTVVVSIQESDWFATSLAPIVPTIGHEVDPYSKDADDDYYYYYY